MKILILSFLSRSWCLCMALAMYVMCFDWLGWVSAEVCVHWVLLADHSLQDLVLVKVAFLFISGCSFCCLKLPSLCARRFPNVFVRYFEHSTEIRRSDEVTSGCMTLSLLRRVLPAWGNACCKHGAVTCAFSSPLWHLLEKTKQECCPDTIWKLTERNKVTHMGLSRTLSAKPAPSAPSSYFHAIMPLLMWLWPWGRQPAPYLPNPRMTVQSDPLLLMSLCCCVYPSCHTPCLWDGCKVLASVSCKSPQLLLVTGGCMRYRAPENLALEQYETYVAWVKRCYPVCRSAQCLCENFIVKWTRICSTRIVWLVLDSCHVCFPCRIPPFKEALKIWQYLKCKRFTVRQQAMSAYQQYTNVAYLSSCPFKYRRHPEDSQTRPVVLVRVWFPVVCSRFEHKQNYK